MEKFRIEGLKNDVFINDMRCTKAVSDERFNKCYAPLTETFAGRYFMENVLKRSVTSNTPSVEVALCDDMFALKTCVKTDYYLVAQIDNHDFLYVVGKSSIGSGITLAILAFDLTLHV